MKGFIGKALTGAAAACGLAGCCCQDKYIDPCYPERYVYTARREVTAAFAPQVQNGRVLDQTIWNFHFDQASDRLNAGGMDCLDTLIRRRPSPDPRIFLATARDLSFDPLNPDRFVDQRRDLDEKRATAIQKYVTAQTAGRPVQFEVVIHDPIEVYEHAYSANRAVLLMQTTTGGSIAGGSSAQTAGQGQNQQGSGSSGVAGPPPAPGIR